MQKNLYALWKSSMVYWINIIPCLHYLGAYEFMDCDSTGLGIAQAE